MKDEKIIEAIQRRNRPGCTFAISRTVPKFFSGELVVVDVSKDGAPLGENYVYVNAGTIDETFLSFDEVASWASFRSSRTGVQNFAAISGTIAVLVTITICILVLAPLMTGRESLRIPEILSNALTMILGFYFGSQVAARQSARRQSTVPSITAPPTDE